MDITVRPEGLLERAALWFNLGPWPLAQSFFGMMASRAAMAGVRLGIFRELASSQREAGPLAQRLGLEAQGLSLLLESLRAARLLERGKVGYGLSPRARPWLDPDSPRYVGDFLEFNYTQWEWWSGLEETLRGNRGPRIHEYPPEDPRWRQYILAMFQLARLAAPEVAAVLGLPRSTRTLLDVAGAHGAFSAELCRRLPGLSATVLDLPASAAIGRELIAKEGMAERVRHVDGDALHSELGGPYDAVLCFQFLHHLSPADGRALLGRLRGALEPGGRLAILEHFPDEPGRVGAASLLGLHYFVTSGGATYGRAEVEGWLRDTGFIVGRSEPIRRLPLQTLLLATRG